MLYIEFRFKTYNGRVLDNAVMHTVPRKDEIVTMDGKAFFTVTDVIYTKIINIASYAVVVILREAV